MTTEPLYGLGDAMLFTGVSVEEEERTGQIYNIYSYYESGANEISETYISTSPGTTHAELSWTYQSVDNNQGIVDHIEHSFSEYQYDAGGRITDEYQGHRSGSLGGKSEETTNETQYYYASTQGNELEYSTSFEIRTETEGGVNSTETEFTRAEYIYLEPASDIEDWHQMISVSEHDTDFDSEIDFTQFSLETKTESSDGYTNDFVMVSIDSDGRLTNSGISAAVSITKNGGTSYTQDYVAAASYNDDGIINESWQHNLTENWGPDGEFVSSSLTSIYKSDAQTDEQWENDGIADYITLTKEDKIQEGGRTTEYTWERTGPGKR